MEWYLRENIDDFIVPDNHDVFEATSIDDVIPSQDDWCHWEIPRSEDLGSQNGYYAASTIPSVEDLNFNRQNLYFKVSNESPHYQVEGYSSVSTCGQPSLVDCSMRNSKASFSDQPDFELDNDLEKMDDDFCNSFLEDDQIFPDSMYRSLPFEDILSNMGADPQNWLDSSGAENSAANSSSFPLFMDHNLEDTDKAADSSPCLRPDKCDRSEGSPTVRMLSFFWLVYQEDVLCATKKSEPDSTNVDEPKSFEETALLELEDVMLQLTKKTRICFRDAFYRLAKSSEQQHMICQNKSVSYSDEYIVGQTAHESSRDGRSTCVESNTNVIDRTVANLMYNTKACCDVLLA